jgi:hypothetical protein
MKFGGVYCWGNNDNGQLGTNDTTERLVPTAVNGLVPGNGFSQLCLNSVFEQTCMITHQSILWNFDFQTKPSNKSLKHTYTLNASDIPLNVFTELLKGI